MTSAHTRRGAWLASKKIKSPKNGGKHIKIKSGCKRCRKGTKNNGRKGADDGKQPFENRESQKAISIRNLEEASSKPGLSNKRLDCGSLRSHNLTLFVGRDPNGANALDLGRSLFSSGATQRNAPDLPGFDNRLCYIAYFLVHSLAVVSNPVLSSL